MQLACALQKLGVGRGDTVAVMCPNTPPMYESHFGIPMTGAVLNALNYRLDANGIAFILQHANARVLLTDTAFAPIIRSALEQLSTPPIVIDIEDPLLEPSEAATAQRLGTINYEAFLTTGDHIRTMALTKR